MRENGLPEGWIRAPIGEVCTIRSGFGFPKEFQGRQSGELPFYKVGDISKAWQNGSHLLGAANHYLSREAARAIGAKAFPPGATVFAKIGAAIRLNRRAMLSKPSLVDNNVMGLVPHERILSERYLYYFTWTLRLDEYARATTVPSLRKGDLAGLSCPLPGVGEQRRIVAAIEEHFTKLDAAVAALKRTRANLRSYHASVLHAACTGRLVPTEAELARAEGREYEPADELLGRILRERRVRWEEAELEKMRARGKEPKNDKWKAKYKDPAEPHVTDAPSLPQGWVWARLEQALESLRNGISTKPDAADGLPILRISAVRPLSLDLGDVRYLSGSWEDYDHFRLQEGDLLFTRYNGNAALVGVSARVRVAPGRVVYPDKLIRGRPLAPLVAPGYLEVALNTGSSLAFIASRRKTTAGQSGIAGRELLQTPIPLPPAAEQERIVAEVDRRLSVVERLEETVDHGLKRAERLRQAILKRAFEGRLVPQDPNDEPASVLLERIRNGDGAPSSRSEGNGRARS